MNSRSVLILLGLLFFQRSATFGQTPPEPKKILFIGNSYTGGIRQTVTELIKSSPPPSPPRTFINPGGKTLAFHLANPKTIEKIKTGNFDFVVLQDQSQTPALFPKKFKAAALGLDKIIDASGAQTVFYQTWGRRDGDKQNKKLFPDYSSMQKALSKSYASTAKACKANLAPVGDTWRSLRKKNPKLGQELYAKDGSHPSKKGAYLAACVFYQTFFKEDSKTLTFTANLPAAEAKLIRELSSSHSKK
jgi:hypothetical protein